MSEITRRDTCLRGVPVVIQAFVSLVTVVAVAPTPALDRVAWCSETINKKHGLGTVTGLTASDKWPTHQAGAGGESGLPQRREARSGR